MNPVYEIKCSKKRKSNDDPDCFICSTSRTEKTVENPQNEGYEKLVECITKRAGHGEQHYCKIVDSFAEGFSIESIKNKNLKWHRSCYQHTTNKTLLDRLDRARPPTVSEEVEPATSQENTSKFTRSQSKSYDRKSCFFCDGIASKSRQLIRVATDKAGKNLCRAVEFLNCDKLRVRLSEAVSPNDAHAIDVLYHADCWRKHVFHTLRSIDKKSTTQKMSNSSIAASVEFLNILEEELESGKMFSMDTLQEFYLNICQSNEVPEEHVMSRRLLKNFIEVELSGKDVEFLRPAQRNQSERVAMRQTRVKILSEAENDGCQRTRDMHTLFKAASILRKLALSTDQWTFNGSIPTDLSKIIPENMKLFFKWIILGPKEIAKEKTLKNEDTDRRACNMSQILLFNCLSRRQVENKESTRFENTRECPLQVASGLTVHHLTRNKRLINFIQDMGCSINYSRVLRYETLIAQNVLHRIKENNGVYVPPEIVSGRFFHCAMDNVDFSEDTVDGRRTFHGTSMTVYQTVERDDPVITVSLDASDKTSVDSYESCLPNIIFCAKPVNWKTSFTTGCHDGINKDLYLPEKQAALHDFYSWIFLRKKVLDGTGVLKSSPTWAGFHSLIRQTNNVTRVSLLPVIPESPTKLSVQFSVMNYLDQLKSTVNPTQDKIVVTADMALYKPLKQLQMARDDCKGKWILKPGELHIVIAQLRTIGEFIQGSGLPETWIECDLYSPVTMKQILDGRHIRRAIEAHITTASALSILLFEEFERENPGELNRLNLSAEQLATEIHNGSKEKMLQRQSQLVSAIKDQKISESLQRFINFRSATEPVFKMACLYLEMVQTMLFFIRAVRTGDWNLGLASLHDFLKFFFSLNRLNYARMISLYLSEMDQLKITDPLTWEHFMRGEWVVNRNSVVPFCSLGADEALEHQNKKLKVQGGIIGITQNENARNRFFLVSPELSRIASETKELLGSKTQELNRHHELSVQVQNRQDSNVLKIKDELQNSTNPFQCKNSELTHILSHRVFPKEVKDFVTKIAETGETLQSNFYADRIQNKNVPFWDPMKKTVAATFASASKKVKIVSKNSTISMKTNFSLVARLLIASRNRPDIDIKLNISSYEFTALPKSLFGLDGEMHHCQAKSKLIGVLESIVETNERDPDDVDEVAPSPVPDGQISGTGKKAAIVDGMAFLHTYFKPSHVKTCQELSTDISKKLVKKFEHYDEVHVVFDTYKLDSLKKATREHRSQGTDQIQYRISAEMKVSSISMAKLLAHEGTKDGLTAFLSSQILETASKGNNKFIVSWRDKAKSSNTMMEVPDLCTTQEEADTKIMLHGAYLKKNGTEITHIFSPDTDVMVLAIRRVPVLSPQLGIFLGQGMKKFIDLIPIYKALGPLKASALPGFHALSGADITGSFANKGKLKWWKVFISTNERNLNALAKLGTSSSLTEEIRKSLEELICQLYIPKTSLTDVGEVRWQLFCKKQFQDENLPPTRGALDPALLRAHLQALVWNSDLEKNPKIPSPTDCGWRKIENTYEPITCTNPCVPELAWELCRCNCTQKRCTPPCACQAHSLKCTEMCKCEGKPDLCENFADPEEEEEEELNSLNPQIIEEEDDEE